MPEGRDLLPDDAVPGRRAGAAARPQVRLILATGGGAMVRAAYSSGKPAIGVGAGNGPAYIHRSADIPRAVRDILRSKTFDNGTVCASEQSVIVERCCEARVREEFRKQGCYFLNTEEAGRVARLLLRPDGTINPRSSAGRPAPWRAWRA